MKKLLIPLVILMFTASCNNIEKKSGNENAGLKALASPADSVSAEPYLFTDKNDLVYLSWVEKTKDQSMLKFSTLNNEQWSKPVIIASGEDWFVNWADYPLIASDGNGNMLAHFLQKSEKGKYTYDVKVITSSDRGASWSAAKIINEDGKKAEHGFLSMVPNGNDYFISWLDGRNAGPEEEGTNHDSHHGAMSIRAALVNKQGIKSSEWELDNRVCDCCQTSATITSNGPVVVYRDRSENEIRDMSIVRLVDGHWTEPQTIFKDNWKISGCPVNGPRSDAQGNSLGIVWFSAADSIGQVKVIFSSDGGANFSSPVRIDEGKGIGRVDIIMLDEKSAFVSWMEGGMIKAVKVHADGKKDESIIISATSESRSSGFPQMTRSGNKIIFAWSDVNEKTIKVAGYSL